jgi:hypothetical protein
MPELDLNNYFKYGYSVSSIPKEWADTLLQWMDSEQYAKEADEYGLDNPSSVALSDSWQGVRHPEAPDWDKKQAFCATPKHWKEFWQKFSESEYFDWWRNLYGDFTFRHVMAHKYVKSDGMGWHYDVKDASFMINLIYLSRDTWTIDDGGYIELGHCNVTDRGIPIHGTVQSITKIPPNHGTIVTMTNMNPSILHRVEKLKTDKVRYVAVCQLGYIGNVCSKGRTNV